MNSDEFKNIKKMYKNLTYFDQYGGSCILFIIITIIVFVICAYSYVMINIQPIKNDWVNQRCKPYVIPFAGIINKPDNLTATEFTSQNFQYCTQNILSSITGTMLEPITFVTKMINNILDDIKEAINSIRAMFDKVRSLFEKIVQEIMGRIMNIMIPLQKIIIGFKDLMGKIQGTMTAGLFTLLGSFYTLQALLGAIAEFIITILITLAMLVAIFWIMPFTWGAASAMTAVFLAIAIPMIIILAFMVKYMKVTPALRIPTIKCFDKNTLLLLKDGTSKKIIDIEVGDELEDYMEDPLGNKVTAKIKVNALGSIMYYLNNVIVSDSHIVKYKNKWISVSEHPLAKKISSYNEPFLYCLNTNNKTIKINNVLFSDWDEVCEDSKFIRKEIKTRKDIHKYLDCGFKGETKIQVKNGSLREINKIEVGDILLNGEEVYGLVSIDGKEIISQNTFYLGNDTFIEGGSHLNICDSKIDIKTIKKSNDPILYHLLTNTKTFYIDKIKTYDYNACIDLFLDKSK
jgi:hypothetical protein